MISRLSFHRIFLALLMVVGVCMTTACEDNISNSDHEYDNWKSRNQTHYQKVASEAKKAIAKAKEQYGENWKEHCNYRFFRSYMITDLRNAHLYDSICVEILEKGKGDVSPIYTDTVSVNFLGRLIPSASYPEGKVFAHSGSTIYEQQIFDSEVSSPMNFGVKNVVIGLGTALMHMHAGDRWKVYIPSELGYYASKVNGIPLYSNLIYDIQLTSFSR